MNMIEEAITKLRNAGRTTRQDAATTKARERARREEARATAKARQSRRSARSTADIDLVSAEGSPDITPEQVRAIVKEEMRQRKKAALRAAGANGEQKKASSSRADKPRSSEKVDRNERRQATQARPAKLDRRIGNSRALDTEVVTTQAFAALDSTTGMPSLNSVPSTEIPGTESRSTMRERKSQGRTARTVKVNLKGLHADGYMGADGEAGVLPEEFRRIKRPLLANAFGQGLPAAHNGERIMVTSALPSEGKSFCAIHLALSIASEVENSVVLIEADVAKPTVLEKLGIKPQRGLTNWFEDQTLDVTDLTVATNLPGLKIVPAGKNAPDSIDMLASRAMGRFFDLLREAYPNHLIIVDAPPLLPATETKVLATNMGQVIVVVEAGVTPKSVVADGLEMLKDIEIVGLVLNKSQRQSKNAGYGYGYGY